MSYDHFKRKVQKAYPDAALSFSSNGAQHMAKVEGHLILYTNADSNALLRYDERRSHWPGDRNRITSQKNKIAG